MACNQSPNSVFLAIDTTGDTAALILADYNGAIIASSRYDGRRSLSQRLIGEIDNLLKANNLTIDDIGALAVCVGPGSFTGTRIGLTTMKTFAQVTGKPLVGVCSTDAYARIVENWQNDNIVHALLPSRKSEVYAASYTFDGRRNLRTLPADNLNESLKLDDKSIVIGYGALTEGLTGRVICRTENPVDGFVKCIVERIRNNDYDDPIGLIPLYAAPPAISKPKDPSVLPQANNR